MLKSMFVQVVCAFLPYYI